MTAMDGGNAVFAGAKNCPCHRVIAYRDVGTQGLPGVKTPTAHPEHTIRNCSLRFQDTAHPWA